MEPHFVIWAFLEGALGGKQEAVSLYYTLAVEGHEGHKNGFYPACTLLIS